MCRREVRGGKRKTHWSRLGLATSCSATFRQVLVFLACFKLCFTFFVKFISFRKKIQLNLTGLKTVFTHVGHHLCKFMRTNKIFALEKGPTHSGFVWNTSKAAVSLFWNTNMAAVTSCENALHYCVSVWTLALA